MNKFQVLELEYANDASDAWFKLLEYWTGPRAVIGQQTVDFIGERAAYCTVQAVRAKIRAMQLAGKPTPTYKSL